MRIPAEAVTQNFVESDAKPIKDGQRAEAVDGTAGLRATLSHTLRKRQGRTEKEETLPPPEENGRRPAPEENAQPPGGWDGVERRRHDRRQSHQPTPLDTRMSRGRRKTDQLTAYPSINLKV